MKCDADVYQVKLNVSDFAPDDVSVRVRSGEVVVEAAHPELPAEHGTTSRQFTRRFVLPEVRVLWQTTATATATATAITAIELFQ